MNTQILSEIEKEIFQLKIDSRWINFFSIMLPFLLFLSLIFSAVNKNIEIFESILSHNHTPVVLSFLGKFLVYMFSFFKRRGDSNFKSAVENIEKFYKDKKDKSEALPSHILNQMRNYSKASKLPLFYGENGHVMYFFFFFLIFIWRVTILMFL